MRGCREFATRRSLSRLGRMRPTIAISMLAAAAALTLAACGEEEPRLLPGATAQEITVNLDSVRDLADAGDCLGAEGAARQVGEQIEAVEVDRELKRALEKGATRLSEVVAECEEGSEEGTEPVAPPAEEEAEGEVGDERSGRENDRDRGRNRPQTDTRPNRPTTPQTPPGGEEGRPPEPPPNEGDGVEEGGEGSGGVSPAVPADEG